LTDNDQGSADGSNETHHANHQTGSGLRRSREAGMDLSACRCTCSSVRPQKHVDLQAALHKEQPYRA
jgi:hypothetical protein